MRHSALLVALSGNILCILRHLANPRAVLLSVSLSDASAEVFNRALREPGEGAFGVSSDAYCATGRATTASWLLGVQVCRDNDRMLPSQR